MERTRATWTEQRLDDLSSRMELGGGMIATFAVGFTGLIATQL